MYDTRKIQEALQRLDYNLGPAGVDGVMGRATIAAIKAFQRTHNLYVDGIVGKNTAARLWPEFDAGISVIIPPWVTEANRFIGLHEVRDAKQLDKALNLDASEIPWCGAFTGMIIANVLPGETIPANPLWALNWKKFGVALTEPYFGAIAVFKRKAGGHVGFVVGHDAKYVHLLGGNQSNQVSVTKVSKTQLEAYRWPSTYALVGLPLLHSTFTGKVFDNAD